MEVDTWIGGDIQSETPLRMDFVSTICVQWTNVHTWVGGVVNAVRWGGLGWIQWTDTRVGGVVNDGGGVNESDEGEEEDSGFGKHDESDMFG